MSTRECMSVARCTNSVSCHKNTCQGHMMLCIVYVSVKLKLSQAPNIGIYAPLTGTVAGPFGEIELEKCNCIILVYAIFI